LAAFSAACLEPVGWSVSGVAAVWLGGVGDTGPVVVAVV